MSLVSANVSCVDFIKYKRLSKVGMHPCRTNEINVIANQRVEKIWITPSQWVNQAKQNELQERKARASLFHCRILRSSDKLSFTRSSNVILFLPVFPFPLPFFSLESQILKQHTTPERASTFKTSILKLTLCKPGTPNQIRLMGEVWGVLALRWGSPCFSSAAIIAAHSWGARWWPELQWTTTAPPAFMMPETCVWLEIIDP